MYMYIYIVIKWLPVTFCYSHRSVSCLATIREASLCSLCNQIQRHTTDKVQRVRDLETTSPKWDAYDKSLLSGLRELFRTGCHKDC